MENLNAEQAINELETQTKYAKFIESKGVLLSAKCAQFCLDHIQYYEQRIKELTEENERLRADKDYWKSRSKESESEYNQAVKRGYNLGAIDYVGSFAERLKAEKFTHKNFGELVYVEDIDQIAKEMLEGG